MWATRVAPRGVSPQTGATGATPSTRKERAVREASPAATLIEITTGHILPRCLHVVAELGVADALDGTPAAPPRSPRR